MAINFRDNPENGATITEGSRTFTYNSTKGVWNRVVDASDTSYVDETKAPLESPVFTGTPRAPTAVDVTSTTQIASTAFVQSLIAGVSSGGGSGVSVVASAANLPVSADAGTLSYTTDTNKMFCFNGTTWILVFTATTLNATPNLVTGPLPGYLLATDGTATVITLAAQDPEEVPLVWSYAITSGVIGNTATVSQVDNVITVTPSTNSADAGRFVLTISVSDGVNVMNAATVIRLSFSLEDFSYGLSFKGVVPYPPQATNTENLRYGTATHAHGGTLAVVSRAIDAGGGVSSSNSEFDVHIYETLSGDVPVYHSSLTKPSGATRFAGNGDDTSGTTVKVFGDMILVYGTTIIGANGMICVFVYYKINNVWTLTQTLANSIEWAYLGGWDPEYAAMNISDDGLTMVLGQGYDATGSSSSGDQVEIKIYTRNSIADNTWTLRQTLTAADLPMVTGTVGFADWFPSDIEISQSGKHIVMYSSDVDLGADDNVGMLMVFTNETRMSGNYNWTVSSSRVFNDYSTDWWYSHHLKFGADDDIFYIFNRPKSNYDSTILPSDVPLFTCNKYSSSAWTEYPYDNHVWRYAQRSTYLRGNHSDNFIVRENPTGSVGEVTFMFLQTHWSYTSESMILSLRAKYKDLEGRAGLDTSFIEDVGTANNTTGAIDSYQHAGATAYLYKRHPIALATKIYNDGDTAAANEQAQTMLTIDKTTGDIFVTNMQAEPGGISRSGIVTKYRPARDAGVETGYSNVEYWLHGGVQSYNDGSTNPSKHMFDIVVPEGVDRMSTIQIGSGGGTSSTLTNLGTGGAGGGSFFWINDVSVTPGDIVSIGVGGAPNGKFNNSVTTSGAEVLLNGVRIAWAFGGYSRVNSAYGGSSGGISYSTGQWPANASGQAWAANSNYGQFRGGTGGAGSTTSSYNSRAGGGGAGGYGAVGGNGQSAYTNVTSRTLGANGSGDGGALNQYGNGVYLNGIGTTSSFSDGLTRSTYNHMTRTQFGRGGAGFGYTATGDLNGFAGGIRLMFGYGYRVTHSDLISTSPLLRNYDSDL
jgi:hypothetical protein